MADSASFSSRFARMWLRLRARLPSRSRRPRSEASRVARCAERSRGTTNFSQNLPRSRAPRADGEAAGACRIGRGGNLGPPGKSARAGVVRQRGESERMFHVKHPGRPGATAGARGARGGCSVARSGACSRHGGCPPPALAARTRGSRLAPTAQPGGFRPRPCPA